jgi:hypothetical protein
VTNIDRLRNDILTQVFKARFGAQVKKNRGMKSCFHSELLKNKYRRYSYNLEAPWIIQRGTGA